MSLPNLSPVKILDFLIDETAKLKLTFLSFSDFFFRFCTFHAVQSKLREYATTAIQFAICIF